MDGDTDTIGDGEAREVAWCTKKGHGTRIIPQGALQGAQWLYAKNYVQVVGYIDQSKINLDPHRGLSDPAVGIDMEPQSGPVITTIAYRIDPADAAEFVAAMAERRRIRVRDGARDWMLLQDVANPLSGAHLEFRRIQSSDSRELFAFEIPFDKYLASKK